MSEAPAVRKAPPPVQSFRSAYPLMTSRQPYTTEPIASKHVCFYKSGDAQFNGLPVVINSRTFKTFEALLDSLSKRVPLPFGVRTITTPRGRTAIRSLEQLCHGQSYICSDKRTVKPVDLVRARHKPPPWYHTRPFSSGRLARQNQNQNWARCQGRRPVLRASRGAGRSQNTPLLHAPRRLVVFRNGDPEVRHTLSLQRKSTISFEALLNHISEVMRFPVLKLHTADGRRLDGLSALILCSGVLVAAGREPFRKGDYDIQKSSAPTWQPVKRVGRQCTMLRKKKSMARRSPCSPSSEHYTMSQTQDFAGYDFPSNPPGSVERKTSQLLASVAETDAVACLDSDGEENVQIPTNEDIEKSFRVNQDGSMTVEMKVRLTIKEEETIQWTTTLNRSCIASQMKCIYESPSGLDISLTDKIPTDVDPVPSDIVQSCPEDQSDISNKDSTIWHDGVEEGRSEENMSVKEPLPPLSSTLGQYQLQQEELSVGTARKPTETESKENPVGSYDYREETGNGEMKQEYRVLQQCSTRPVPKPRSSVTTELNSLPSQQMSTSYKPTEILQDGREKVHETTIHVYEQQICQENFFANTQLCVQSMGICGLAMGHEETSDSICPVMSKETAPFCSENLRSELQTSTNYETLHRQENFTQFNKNIPQELISTESKTCSPITELVKASASKNPSKVHTSKRKKPVRVIVKKNHIFQSSASERKRKDNETDILKEIKKIRADIFKQAGATRLSECYKGKAAQALLKNRNNYFNSYENIPSMLPNTVQLKIQSPNELPAKGELCTNEKSPAQANLSSGKMNKGLTSSKKELLQETRELKENICLPSLHSSSLDFSQYVELWLQKSDPNSHSEQEQEPSTKTKPSPKVSVITAETQGTKEAEKEDVPFHVSPDKTLCPRNQLGKNKSSEQASLLDGKSTEKIAIQTAVLKNVCLKKAPFTNETTSEKNSASSEPFTISELSKNQETDTPLGKTSAGNGHVKLPIFPRNYSSENTSLSQSFTDLIPQNNTLLKASLFSCQTEEKKIFHRKKTDKKSDALYSGLNMELVSKSTLMDKSQVSSDSAKSNENQQSVSPQGDTGTCETDKCPSLRMSSDAEMIEKQCAVKMEEIWRDMRHILEELCLSIRTLCEVTQHKRRCCLEKSHSLPDISSHMANTLGSSSRMLMAFLSVLTLKDGLANLNAQRQAEGSQSCSEALFVLQALKEMAAIEDAEQLKASLNALQNKVSVQLLERWRGFQELNHKPHKRYVVMTDSRSDSHSGLNSEEKVIQGLMEELGVPDRVRGELANFRTQEEDSNRGNWVEGSEKENEFYSEVKVNKFLSQLLGEETISFHHTVFEEEVNTYVKSVIKKAIKTHLEESSVLSVAQLLACTENETKVLTGKQERDICNIERTEQDDHVPASGIYENMSSHDDMEEKTEVRDAIPVRTAERGEVDAKHKGKHGLDEKEYLLETNAEYPNTLDYIEEKETVEKVKDARGKNEDRITDIPSSNENKPAVSEEEKFSLGELSLGNKFNEDLMSCSEDHINDEENLQMDAATVIGTDQKDHMQRPLDKLKNEDHKSESQHQLHMETYCVQHCGQSRKPATLLAMYVESCMQENSYQPEAQQEQVIYEEKHAYSEEEQLDTPVCFTIDQEHFVEQPKYDSDEAMEGCEENIIHFTEKKENFNSMPELIGQRVRKISVKKFLAHTELPEVSETNDLTNVAHIANETDRIQENKKTSSKVQSHGKRDSENQVRRISQKDSLNVMRSTKQSHVDMTSELLSSSLAFSYESPSRSVAQEPELGMHVNRVQSIREMFLAKSSSRIQNAKRHSPSSNSDLSDYQPESTDSEGNHSQTSPDTYSGDDDTSRLAIAKGFVRKTIERLYGRSNSDSTADVKRPVSASKGKHRGPGRTHVKSLTSFHEGCTQRVTDLSYFNATNSIDSFNKQTHSASPNYQEPGDTILTDRGHWMPHNDQSIHESFPDLQEPPKKETKITAISSVKPDQDAAKEDVPYSLFCPPSPHRSLPSTKLEELSGSSGPKFTYFNLPNANDSDLELEERKSNSSEKTEAKVTSVTQSPKSWENLKSFLPAFRPPVIKKADNKVHPLIEAVAPPVVTQPVRGQSAHTDIIRHSTESDLLEMLFIFCGQHCPIL